MSEFWIEHAINEVYKTYGDHVCVKKKGKSLFKFGRNSTVGTAKEEIWNLPTGETEETYITGNNNTITHFSSGSGSDTGSAVVEGHTVQNDQLTFVVQTITLAGQTKTALTTPLHRITRSYNPSSTDWVGVIYFYEDDTVSSGVPQTATKIHLQIPAGLNQSEKASTSISNTDYWFLTSAFCDTVEKTNTFVDWTIEVRERGGVFRQRIPRRSTSDSHGSEIEFSPYLIVPKNSDVRIVATADGANTDVTAGMNGILAAVI